MKLHLIPSIGLLLSLAFGLQAAEQGAPSGGAAKPMELSVMTYNVRYASQRPPNAWPDRRPLVRDCIRQYAPDVIGTQEGVYQQVKEMAADLPEYEWIGLGRDGGSRGEFMAVFYRKDRLEPLEYDHYWLSDTPDVMASVTWGHVCKRMVTWVKFRDRQSGQQFYFLNTHFDHESQPAREKSAELVLQRTNALKTNLPILLVGDFNADNRNKAYATLTAENAFIDTWTIARKRINENMNTFNSFKVAQEQGRRIDWILARGKVSVSSTEIVTFARDGQYPSDHFPVVANVRIEAP